MGRIHRIGQTRDVHIYNMVAMNTREGAVLLTLLHKLENMAGALGETVFDVIGEIFAGARLAELIEKVLAGEVTEQQAIEHLGGATLDPATEEKFRALTAKALATHHLDWQAQADSEARANERRLPPGYPRALLPATLWTCSAAASQRGSTRRCGSIGLPTVSLPRRA